MFCSNCGNKLEEGVKFCSSCGFDISGNQKVKKEVKPLTPEEMMEGDRKIFKIVSYIGILWILGIFCGSKNDSKVRFHVGQGIILTLGFVAVGIVSAILSAIVFATCQNTLFGHVIGGLNPIGTVLIVLINLVCYGAYIFYMVCGLINAVKGREKALPLIGNLAFYK